MSKKIVFTMSCLLITIIFAGVSYAGPKAAPGCILDMNFATKTIESEIAAGTSDIVSVAVVTQNVSNLDTYQAEVKYDQNILKFIGAYEEVPTMGIRNLLKKNGGTTIGFQAVEKKPGLVNIANALTGTNTDEAPEGSGIIAVMRFKVLRHEPSQLSLLNVRFADSSQDEVVVARLKGGKIN